MNNFQRMVLYCFPLYLCLVEQLAQLYFSTEPDTSLHSIVTSISVAGLSLLLPLLAPSPVAQIDGKTVTYNKQEARVSLWAWFFLFVFTPMWLISLSEKLLKESPLLLVDAGALHFPLYKPILLANVIYFIGVLMTEIKEIE